MSAVERHPRFYILPVRGVLSDTASRNSATTTPEAVSEFVKHILRDRSAAGTLLAIHSPGGTVSASEAIHEELVRLSERMPVIAHINGIGASGAYMAALAADFIGATRSSLIGSVGVIMQLNDISKALDRFGIRIDVLTTGKFKGAGGMFTPRGQEELEYFRHILMRTQTRFLKLLEARALSDKELEEIRSAKVYDAEEAFELNLINRVLTLQEAKDVLIAFAYEEFRFRPKTAMTWVKLETKQTFLQKLLSARAQTPQPFNASAAFEEWLRFVSEPGPWALWLP